MDVSKLSALLVEYQFEIVLTSFFCALQLVILIVAARLLRIKLKVSAGVHHVDLDRGGATAHRRVAWTASAEGA